MSYDIVIAGGGPAGLSAALILGRGRKRVLLCDAGPRRNAAAAEMHGFVTRDGTPPAEFRRAGREQLAEYPNVEVRDVAVEDVRGELDAFEVALGDGEVVRARRVLLCLGMIDELPAWPGVRELWGGAIFQCPYCHGWEVRDRVWGSVIGDVHQDFPLFLQGWTRDVIAFTDGRELPAELRARFAATGVRVEARRIERIEAAGAAVGAVIVEGGARVACDVLQLRPKQRQTPLVARLGLALDENGYVRVEAPFLATSRPGIHAAGDLTTQQQAALVAAAAGAQAAYGLNHALTMPPA